MRSGYVTLATGSKIYIEQAVNLALSIKLNDPTRGVCLVTNAATYIPEEYRKLFAHIVLLSDMEGYFGCLNKLRVRDASPFDESMFIDSDCLVIKNDMDRHWLKLGGAQGFGLAGECISRGVWYGIKIEEAILQLGIPHFVKMNSGVFYFDKSEKSAQLFDTANRLVKTHGTLLGQRHRNKIQLADEPFLGVAMAMHSIAPISYRPEEGSIMITTVRSSRANFDPFQGESFLLKHDKFMFLDRFLPRVRVSHSPTIAHFVQLKPLNHYRGISNKLRGHFGVREMN